MRHIDKITVICAVLLVATACGNGTSTSQPQAAVVEAAPAAQPPEERVMEVVSPLISSSVSVMDNCEPVKAVLTWDITQAHPQTASVQVWVGSDPATASLFSESGPSGSAETDTWVRPGTAFRLVDPTSGSDLASIVVGGPVCR